MRDRLEFEEQARLTHPRFAHCRHDLTVARARQFQGAATFDNDPVAVDNLSGTTQSNISVTANVAPALCALLHRA